MTSWITRALFLLVAVVATATAQPPPLAVGAAVSLTGAHADLAADYGRGMQLWAEEANASGGVLGRRVELRILDDGSEARRAGLLYRQLIQEGADALIGPFGTAATLLAAAEAESAGRVLINAAGWSDAIHRRSPRFVFQSAVPYDGYGNVMALAANAGVSRALVLARDDPAALEMASAASAAAASLGIVTGPVRVFPTSTPDFAPYVEAARQTGAQAWVAFCEVNDAAEMVKTFKRLDYAPTFFYARAASEPRLLRLLGQDAEMTLGAVRYHPGAPTPGNARFVSAYKAKWGMPPTPAAAEGYAGGLVLAEGLTVAGTADAGPLRSALAALRTSTILGPYRVNPATGEQTATQPVLTQVRRGRPVIVGPPELRRTPPELPYPQWSARQYLE